jgi:hypothetical protein
MMQFKKRFLFAPTPNPLKMLYKWVPFSLNKPFKQLDETVAPTGKKHIWLDSRLGLTMGLRSTVTNMTKESLSGEVPEQPLELSNHMLLLTKERMVLEAKYAAKTAVIKSKYLPKV